MYSVLESLDTAEIGRVRKECKGKGLDALDNFCFHLAIIDDGVMIGEARFFTASVLVELINKGSVGGFDVSYLADGRFSDTDSVLVLDGYSLKKTDDTMPEELLPRALLLRAKMSGKRFSVIPLDRSVRNEEYYLQFGFNRCECGNALWIENKDVDFNGGCKGRR